MKYIRFFLAFFCSVLFLTFAHAQTGYYLNPNTGQREVIFLVITPLGTDAQYRNDYSVQEYKPILIKGDPMKVKKAKATLPTSETITMIFPTDKEYAKFVYTDGQIKPFREASLYTLKKNNQLAQIAIQAYLQKDSIRYRVFYKPLESKTEQQLQVAGAEYKEKGQYYKIIMPDGNSASLEEYTEGETFLYKLLLTESNGKKTVFTKEE